MSTFSPLQGESYLILFVGCNALLFPMDKNGFRGAKGVGKFVFLMAPVALAACWATIFWICGFDLILWKA